MAKESGQKPALSAKEKREARLAAELRANLKRRKDQARARADDAVSAPDAEAPRSSTGDE